MLWLILFLALFRFEVFAQEPSKVFKIQPLRPVTELRNEALKARPPIEHRKFQEPDLVEVTKIDAAIELDIRYASSNNFLGTSLYDEGRAFLQRPAAEALVRADRKLHAHGYGLLIFDAYRPWYVTKIFWDATPASMHPYVANPATGSRHNRGCAVDLTIYDLKTGKPVSMPSSYDELSERAHSMYPGGTAEERAHRQLLRRTMESEGFTSITTEWWHFDYHGWRDYPILNIPLAAVSQRATE